MPRTGVLLMSFGGPESLADVEPFMRNLIGAEPSPAAVSSARERYAAIGGGSPLWRIASAIAASLGQRLAADGHDAAVAVGMRYWAPSMADGLAALVAAGVERVVAVSLSPFESIHSAGGYRAALAEVASAFPALAVVEAGSFRESPAYVGWLADAAGEALGRLSGGTRNALVFTAHSLPVQDLGGDPYVDELEQLASAVASRLGLPPAATGGQEWLPGVEAFGSVDGDAPWLLAFQSKGKRGGEWIGPEYAEVMRAMAAADFGGVAVSPAGFSTDHLETLYDLDIEAAALARDLGLRFERAAVPNDAPAMAEALAEVVEPFMGQESGE